MPNYDYYDQYRPQLTDEDKMMLAAAAATDIASAKKFAQTPGWTLDKNRVLGGFRSPDGRVISSQETLAHINLAKGQAEQQLGQQEVPMPEEEETTLRFPGTSPKDKYSIIDMKLEQRWNDIEAENPFVSAQVAANINALKLSPFYKQTADQVKETSKQHRLLTRAAKLCRNEEGSQMLHNQARTLETAPCVVQMNQLLEGMEYLQGRRETVPQDVMDLYKNNMGIDLEHTRKTINTMKRTPEVIDLKFENFDDIAQQRAFSNPRNWNKTAAELKAIAPSANEVDNAVRPYAIATVKQKLTPAFERMEQADLDFRDLVIVDGKSIQEHFNEMENAPRDKEAAKNYASMLVATALMNKKKVETFIPTPDGKLPATPTTVNITGYTPQMSGPVVLNAWQRFFSRFGFFKEKAAQADEYKRMMDARERVIPNVEKRAAQKLENAVPDTKKMFFGNLEKELQEVIDLPPRVNQYPNVTRTSPSSVCICIMAAQYPLEDIMDPNKLQAEKQAVAKEYLENAKNGSVNWLTEKLADCSGALQGQINRIAQNTDFTDPVRRAVALPVLCAATRAGYDIYQDVTHNEKLLEAYSETLAETASEAASKAAKEAAARGEMPQKFQYPTRDERIQQGKSQLDRFQAAHTVGSALENAIIAKGNLSNSDIPQNKAEHMVADMVVGDLVAGAIVKGKPLHECAFNTEAQSIFRIQLQQQKEIKEVAKAISENPKARTAMQNLVKTTPMSEVLQVNTAKMLVTPDAHGGVKQATEKIMSGTKVTMTAHLTPVLGRNPVQANQMKR